MYVNKHQYTVYDVVTFYKANPSICFFVLTIQHGYSMPPVHTGKVGQCYHQKLLMTSSGGSPSLSSTLPFLPSFFPLHTFRCLLQIQCS